MPLETVEDIFSDDDHARRDRAVLGYSGNLEQLEPPSALLLLINETCERMVQFSFMECADLVNTYGRELVEVLETSWDLKKFRSIRCLKILQRKTAAQRQTAVVVHAWEGPYEGNAALDFRLTLDDMNSKRGEKLYANFVSLVQSSGTGKSRLLDEIAKTVFTIPFCLRAGVDGYPPADTSPRQFFTLRPHDAYSFLDDRYLLFLEILFAAVTDILQASTIPDSDLPGWWYQYLRAEGARKSLNIGRRIFPTRRLVMTRWSNLPRRGFMKLLENLGFEELYEAPLKGCASVSHTLNTVLNSLRALNIFFVFSSTHFHLIRDNPALLERVHPSARYRYVPIQYAQAPYTGLPVDTWKHGPLVQENCHKLDDIASVAFFVRFGRPLWWSRWKYGDDAVRAWMISFARAKLSADRENNTHNLLFTLAALSIGLSLDFDSRDAVGKEMILVSEHMRVANVIPASRNSLTSSTPSEPILAEAAAHILAGTNMLAELNRHLRNGLVHGGQHGQLVGRLLVTLAYDRAIENRRGPYSHIHNQPLERYFTEPIPVCDFFRALLTDEYVDQVLDMAPVSSDDGGGGAHAGAKFRDVFKEAYISFTHFGKAEDGDGSDWAVSDSSVFMALCRHMAVVARKGMESESVDFFIPYHFGRGEPISRRTCGIIMWSISDAVEGKSANVDVERVYRRCEGNDHPAVVVVMELGAQTPEKRPAVVRTEQTNPGSLSALQAQPEAGNAESSRLSKRNGPEFGPEGDDVRQGDERKEGKEGRGDLACYTVTLRGCNSQVYRVVEQKDEAVYAALLAPAARLSEHGQVG
ncbi:hypothetical protein BOTBODRAFT_188265 [Botryobasidium botryosum FD-172 SS1]|uniref:Uncharacterized protein n=1 Tax=Botryobasidium botryosum (strain FD-172 SS1) TaxID=930990 RepID=A0A067MQC0_BOTB1|nr:hypothetical protein BOTBODRAFT_188265 [Botryobasidium botryosum FD-172 SS1]